MKPYKGKTPAGGTPVRHQERRKQPEVGGAGKDEPYESHTGRTGGSQNVEGTEQPGEEKER